MESVLIFHLSFFSVSVIKHSDQKQLREKKVYLALRAQVSLSLRKVRADIEAETRGPLLAGSPSQSHA